MATTTHLDSDQLDTLFSNLHISNAENALIDSLYRISKKTPKLIRSTEYEAPADPSVRIRSWKMNEFKYYDVPSPFPTLARGLFTQEIKVSGQNSVKYRIVARGYDKFFNIGEVPWTTWSSLEEHTTAPYTLTLKSNGCIIFIAALTPTKLVVTSKHSLGHVKGSESESHAEVGQRWLRQHLKDVGKTEEQLAGALWEKTWTAVAELCDDSFEEHVLPYSKDKTGLHLHGLNECTKEFKTMLPDIVDAFAREWGFIVTPSTVLQTIPEVKSFTEEIGRAQEWNGEALEGFVVRSHIRKDPPRKGASLTPYAPGSSFFFKVKFDEPYMMYRDWREVTKVLLSKGPQVSNVPKSKLRRQETKVYVQWIIEEIKKDRSQFKDYTKGKGIIATRERFLRWLESEDGKKHLAGMKDVPGREGLNTSGKQKTKFGKTIIVPVAIPGVGKTSIAVALAHLFGFGHTQSDDVHATKSAPIFIKNVVNLLKTHDVVIADKNNHLRQHRKQLRDAVRNFTPPVRLMALNWSFDLPLSTIHRICGDRVAARGDNHQTLRADTAKSYEEVLWMFLNQGEELTEDETDVAIEMDVEEDLDHALTRAVDACVDILGVQRPDAEKMGEALAIARGYAPKVKKPEEKKKASSEPRYYALLPEVDLEELVTKRMEEQSSDAMPEDGKTFFKQLVANKRLYDRTPHITIVHSKNLTGENQSLWARCRELNLLATPPLFSFKFGHILWNDRVMAVTVTDLAVLTDGDNLDPDSEERRKGIEFVMRLAEEVRGKLHATVGTKDKDILPVEARDLVARWKSGDRTGIGACELKDMWVKGRVKGLFK